MNPQEKKQFDALVFEVQRLSKLIDQRQRNQIQQPLDTVSKKVVYEDIPIFQDEVVETVTSDRYVTFEINGKTHRLLAVGAVSSPSASLSPSPSPSVSPS